MKKLLGTVFVLGLAASATPTFAALIGYNFEGTVAEGPVSFIGKPFHGFVTFDLNSGVFQPGPGEYDFSPGVTAFGFAMQDFSEHVPSTGRAVEVFADNRLRIVDIPGHYLFQGQTGGGDFTLFLKGNPNFSPDFLEPNVADLNLYDSKLIGFGSNSGPAPEFGGVISSFSRRSTDAPVPEPASAALLLTGMAGTLLVRQRRSSVH